MDNEKRYYWIKLKTNFFNQDSIDFLMSQENGSDYVVLYQMICLNTANSNGNLQSKIGEMIVPYDIEKIVRDCKYFKYDTVVVALELYKKLGLIYENNDDILSISNYEEMVGSETEYARKKREYRSRQKERQLEDNVRQEYRDKILDIRYRDIILKDNNIYHIDDTYLMELIMLYPDVDIEQEIKNMHGWCLSNPGKRKTLKGIKRFINGWLARAQKDVRSSGKKEIKEEPRKSIDEEFPIF